MEADRAITRFALAEFAAAGRRMRHRMQRYPATRIYGDDSGHRTLWDELCHEAANGPAPALESAWEHTLSSFAIAVVEQMPSHTKAILSWHLASLEDDEPSDGIYAEALIEAVTAATREIAAW